MRMALIAAAVLGLGMIGQAQAVPVAPITAPSAMSPDSGIILARAGCGFGAHRGPCGSVRGICRFR